MLPAQLDKVFQTWKQSTPYLDCIFLQSGADISNIPPIYGTHFGIMNVDHKDIANYKEWYVNSIQEFTHD